MNIPDNLPEFEVPIENDDYVPITAELAGTPTTAIEVAIYSPGGARPITAWTAYPGPKTPQVEGRYPVFIRPTGVPKPVVCIGTLVVF